MALKNYSSSFEIADADFTNVTWTGKTKSGKTCKIQLNNAINKGNIDWTLADKGEVVPSIEFEACYSNTDAQTSNLDMNAWTISIDDEAATGAGTILLGLGVFSVNGVDVALCRGGGSFKVEREFRDIAADGDRGSVKGRIVLDGERAKLSMNVLTMLGNFAKLYPGIKVSNPAT